MFRSIVIVSRKGNSYKSVPLSVTPNNQSLESKIHNSDDININSDNDSKGSDPQPIIFVFGKCNHSGNGVLVI